MALIQASSQATEDSSYIWIELDSFGQFGSADLRHSMVQIHRMIA